MNRFWLLAPFVAACSAAPVETASVGSAPAVAASASASVAVLDAETAAAAARLAGDVAWLADDARAGRRAGEQGALDAADWLSKACAELGLEAAGADGWYQDFQVDLEPRDGGSSLLVVRQGDLTKELRGAAVLQPLSYAQAGEAQGELVWLGYGIEDPDQGWDDYAGRDLAGKIAIVVRGTPPEPPAKEEAGPKAAAKEGAQGKSHEAALASNASRWLGGGTIFHKVVTARRHGAAGVLIVSRQAGEGPFAFDAGGGGGRTRVPAVALSHAAGAELVGGDLDGALRTPASQTKLDIGASARLVCDIRGGKGLARNILARQKGVERGRTIVVGAHYDHLGWGGSGSLSGGVRGIHNGADDNASGSAAILELARGFARTPPPCDIVYCWWSAEELGLLGSEHFATQPTFALSGVSAYLNFDMVGRAKGGNLQVLAAGSAAEFPAILDAAAAKGGLTLAVNASGSSFGGSSDHATFLKREIPSLHFFTGLHEDYHKPSDDAERFEAAGCAQVVRFADAVVRDLGARTRVAYVAPKLDDKGRREVRSGFSTWFGSVPNYAWDKAGVLIDGTSAGSPAEKAGLLKGDILVRMDDLELKDIYDFMWVLQTKKPGDIVQVRYLRDGHEESVPVTLSSRGAR